MSDGRVFVQSQANPALAAVFMLVATMFIAATTLLAKALGTDALGPALPAFMVTFGRFAFAFVTIAALVSILRPTLRKPALGLHLMRTICGFAGVTLMFAAAAMIPLTDATAIVFLNPVFGMILAIPLLGEKVGPWRWLAALIALAGAAVLIRPGGSAVEAGALLALGAAMALGLELIVIKRLAGREHPLQVLLVNNALGLCIATGFALAFWQTPTGAQWGGMIALGGLMACAQFCFVNAMARADASYVTPFSYLTLVFAGLYDGVIFSVLPDAVGLIGAALILTGAALLAWREGRRARHP